MKNENVPHLKHQHSWYLHEYCDQQCTLDGTHGCYTAMLPSFEVNTFKMTEHCHMTQVSMQYFTLPFVCS